MAGTTLHEVLSCRSVIFEHQVAHVAHNPSGRTYNRTAFLHKKRRMMQLLRCSSVRVASERRDQP